MEIVWECFYETEAASLESESALEAVRNVFAVALREIPRSLNLTHRCSGICTICTKLPRRIEADISSFALIPRIWLQFGDRLIRIQ
jgi:hypothetical protein